MEQIRFKEGFILRKVFNTNLLMPSGRKAGDYKGALMLNETSTLIFEELKKGSSAEEVAVNLTETYDVSFEKALSDVQRTIGMLRNADVIE